MPLQYHAPDSGIVVYLLEDLDQPQVGGGVDGVEDFRPVERDVRDVRVDVQLDGLPVGLDGSGNQRAASFRFAKSE